MSTALRWLTCLLPCQAQQARLNFGASIAGDLERRRRNVYRGRSRHRDAGAAQVASGSQRPPLSAGYLEGGE
jgi:hypothetical protein